MLAIKLSDLLYAPSTRFWNTSNTSIKSLQHRHGETDADDWITSMRQRKHADHHGPQRTPIHARSGHAVNVCCHSNRVHAVSHSVTTKDRSFQKAWRDER